MMRPGAACAAVGVIAATTSAVGHRVLIDGSDGSARAGHSATMHYCIGLGASVAVSDSRFAAGPGSQTNTVAAHARWLRPGLSPHGRARGTNKTDFGHRVWLDVHQALRPLDEHAVAHGARVRVGAAGGLV